MQIILKFKDGSQASMEIDEKSPRWLNEPFIGELIRWKEGASILEYIDARTRQVIKRSTSELAAVEITLD